MLHSPCGVFAKVFSNADVAKDFLQDVLKISIEKISVVSEATTQEDPFHKGVRFDVLVKEEKNAEAGKPTPGRYFDIVHRAKRVSRQNACILAWPSEADDAEGVQCR